MLKEHGMQQPRCTSLQPAIWLTEPTELEYDACKPQLTMQTSFLLCRRLTQLMRLPASPCRAAASATAPATATHGIPP